MISLPGPYRHGFCPHPSARGGGHRPPARLSRSALRE